MSFVNNVKSVLNASASSSATSIQIVKAVSPYNDPPASGKITLMDSLSGPTKIEIIAYTGRTDNSTYWTLTGVARGQESTTASAWSSSDNAIQTFTAGDALASSGTFPFYKSDGSSDPINLTNAYRVPFLKADGSNSNVPLV
jgi:hypothetical protein|tara:strand:+ start:2420 stop:2845 length:426 start_codon:yes stop_codon:yes gene_type:complete